MYHGSRKIPQRETVGRSSIVSDLFDYTMRFYKFAKWTQCCASLVPGGYIRSGMALSQIASLEDLGIRIEGVFSMQVNISIPQVRGGAISLTEISTDMSLLEICREQLQKHEVRLSDGSSIVAIRDGRVRSILPISNTVMTLVELGYIQSNSHIEIRYGNNDIRRAPNTIPVYMSAEFLRDGVTYHNGVEKKSTFGEILAKYFDLSQKSGRYEAFVGSRRVSMNDTIGKICSDDDKIVIKPIKTITKDTDTIDVDGIAFPCYRIGSCTRRGSIVRCSRPADMVVKFMDDEDFETSLGIYAELDRNHPCILYPKGVARDPDDPTRYGIAMEFMVESLRHLIDKRSTYLSNTDRAIILYSIAYGMGHIHSKGLVNGNLKPSNVFADMCLVSRISDIGVTAAMFDNDTVCYQAPEVLTGSPVTQKSDVFAYGVIMYELITQRLPVDGRTYMRTPRIDRVDIPAVLNSDFAVLLKSCLHADPSIRPNFSDILLVFEQNQYEITGDTDSNEVMKCMEKLDRQVLSSL